MMLFHGAQRYLLPFFRKQGAASALHPFSCLERGLALSAFSLAAQPLPLSFGPYLQILCASSRTSFDKSTPEGGKNAQQSQMHRQLLPSSQGTSSESKTLFCRSAFASPYSLGQARFALPVLARQDGFAPAAPPEIIEARQLLVLLVVAETETGILVVRTNLPVLEPIKCRLSTGGGV